MLVAERFHLRCLPATCSRTPVLPGGQGTSGSGVPALLLPWRDRRAVPPARQRARLGRTCRPPAPRALQRASDCAPSHHKPPAPPSRVHVSLCRRKRRRKPNPKRRVAVALPDTADAAGAGLGFAAAPGHGGVLEKLSKLQMPLKQQQNILRMLHFLRAPPRRRARISCAPPRRRVDSTTFAIVVCFYLLYFRVC